MNTTELIKPVIRFYESGDTRKLCSLKIPNNKAGELFLDVKQESANIDYRFIAELKNRFGKLLGSETFTMFKDSSDINGLYISVEPEYRNKLKASGTNINYKLGEILRLASIIEILENKIKNFIIYSKNTAIYFHSKYNFKPAITSFEERDYALESIINNKTSSYDDIVEKAKKLLQYSKLEKAPEKQRELCRETNLLLEEYIKKVLSEKDAYKKHPFRRGIQMVLTDDTIRDNRVFFNTLFENHGINYTI